MRNELFHILLDKPSLNSHSHHLADSVHATLTLQAILQNSYVGWCGLPVPAGDDKGELVRWLQAVGSRSYFVWLEAALMELYGVDEHLNADNWAVYDNAIRIAHARPDWHLSILREKCGYKKVVLDAYWSPGHDNGHPDLFKPAYRINSFFFGYNRQARDHNGNNLQVMFDADISDINAYTDFLQQMIWEQKQKGLPFLKCAIAYDRSLTFAEATKEQAQKAMQANPSKADVINFQNYVFDVVCKAAADFDIPLQIHTGLGLMEGSNAMRLQPAIARNPATTFILMHGSYPWTHDIAGLTHVYANVWADLCWLPLISSTAATRLLHELIDVCNADQIIWGCDTWTSEESYGARLAFLHVLANVLSERIEAGWMPQLRAEQFAEAIMHDNLLRLLEK